jgi:hypothetical protein
MKRSGTNSTRIPSAKGVVDRNTHRGAPHGECFCKSYILAFGYESLLTTTLALSYPLAYSFVVLPLSVARWSLYDHRHMPTGFVFFAVCTWNLSGAINVLLLVLIRPQLLLLTRPEVKVNVRVGIETERFVGTPKTPKSPDCPSLHSEASQTPLHHCVVVAAPPLHSHIP